MLPRLFVFSLLVSVILADAKGSKPLSNQKTATTTAAATTTTATSTTATTTAATTAATTTTTIAKAKYLQASNDSCESKDEFRCVTNVRCIPGSWVCDGDDDCYDGSDEANCTGNHTKGHSKYDVMFYQPMNPTNNSNNCSLQEFSCFYDGKCVNRSWRCDGKNDCGDWSDERYCDDDVDDDDAGKNYSIPSSISNDSLHHQFLHKDAEICGMNQFKCFSRNTCISINLTCDGLNDCGDWSDEKFCRDHLSGINSTKPKDKQWKRGPCKNESEFKCNTSELCIPVDLKCNKDYDCLDKSDEDDCDYSGKPPVIPVESYFQFIYPINGTKPRCNSSTEFHCSLEDLCIPLEVVCDGRMDCKDGGDERKCEKESSVKPMHGNEVEKVKEKGKPNRRGGDEKTASKKTKVA